jgi:serine phosphatase RsbU (regulator of sigma subunit)
MMAAKSFVRRLALMSLLCACAVLPRRASAEEPAGPQQEQEERIRQLELEKREEIKRELEMRRQLERRALDERTVR